MYSDFPPEKELLPYFKRLTHIFFDGQLDTATITYSKNADNTRDITVTVIDKNRYLRTIGLDYYIANTNKINPLFKKVNVIYQNYDECIDKDKLRSEFIIKNIRDFAEFEQIIALIIMDPSLFL